MFRVREIASVTTDSCQLDRHWHPGWGQFWTGKINAARYRRKRWHLMIQLWGGFSLQLSKGPGVVLYSFTWQWCGIFYLTCNCGAGA